MLLIDQLKSIMNQAEAVDQKLSILSSWNGKISVCHDPANQSSIDSDGWMNLLELAPIDSESLINLNSQR